MASYINGITTYIPQIQPSDVNLQIESQYANMRQSKHDAARQQISNLYGSLLNSPLSREDNNIARDNFFKTIEGDIKRISGMDLSLQQNVTQAQSVFNQLLDDKYILKDMAWTKNFQNQVQISDYLKNVCTDSAECDGQWWDGGDRLLQYQMEDFQNATADDSLRMGDAHYIAKQDVTRMALDFAKQYDVDMTLEQGDGKYIFTQKNGQLAAPVYSAMFNGMIAQNPKVMEYYNAKARVQRLDYMHQHAEEFGSMEAAEQDYINKMLTEMSTVRDDNGNAIQSSSYEARIKEDAENAKTQAERKQAQADGLKVTASQIQDENKANSINQSADKLSQQAMFYEREYDRNNNVVKRINRDANNQIVSGEQIDSVIAKYNMDFDIGNAVMLAAFKDSSVTMREDKYGLERYKASLAAQQKQQQTNTGDLSDMFKEVVYDSDTGGTVTDENIDLFEKINEKAGANQESLQRTLDDNKTGGLYSAWNTFKNSDAYKNLDASQKKAFDETYSELKEIYYNTPDLSKDVLQAKRINVNQEGYKHIEEVENILDKLSSSDSKVSDALTKMKSSISSIKTGYNSLRNAKAMADETVDRLSQALPTWIANNVTDNTTAKKLMGYVDGLKNGNLDPKDTKAILAAMNSGAGEFTKFLSDNNEFYMRNGEDVTEMKLGELIGLAESLSGTDGIWGWTDWDETNANTPFSHVGLKDYIDNALEQNGVEHTSSAKNNWNEWGDAWYEKTSAFDFTNPLNGVGNIIAGSRMLNSKANDMKSYLEERDARLKQKQQDTAREKNDFKINGKSIFETDSNGGYVIDKDGKRKFNSNIEDKLNQKVKVAVPYEVRNSFINNNEAILEGRKTFVETAGIDNEEDATGNINEMLNKVARQFPILTYNGNMQINGNGLGNLSTPTFRISLTNNENLYANKKLITNFNQLSKGSYADNIKLSTSRVSTIEDAKVSDDELREMLNGTSVSEIMYDIQMELEARAKMPKTKKDGSEYQYDVDNNAQFMYAPIALGSADYSMTKVDDAIWKKVCQKHNIDVKEVPHLYIYNHHSQSEAPGDGYNGYTVLDDIYKHSTIATVVDTAGEYTGLDFPYVKDIKVNRYVGKDGYQDGYYFTVTLPTSYDVNTGQFIYDSQPVQTTLPYSIDDGFDIAWYYYKESLMEYLLGLRNGNI